MRVLNVHERELPASATEVGALLDGLASPEDRLWPSDRWPAMRLDRPLGVGAEARLGSMRWEVIEHRPGERVVFEIKTPQLVGEHRFEVEPAGEGRTVLRHVLAADARGWGRVTWPAVIRPIHDALHEDILDHAEEAVGCHPAPRAWSRRVRLLRRLRKAKWPRRTDS